MLVRIVAAGAIVTALGACASNRVEREYGESVRQMINAQVADPRTLTAPSDKPVEGADPDMVNAAIEAFREHVTKPEDVAGQDIVIQVGGQGR